MNSKEGTPKGNKKSLLTLRRKKRIAVKDAAKMNECVSENEDFVENTPENFKSLTPQTRSAPPNFRPYRLSLNKRLCETMTKKRLEFHIAQEKEKTAECTDDEEVPETDEFSNLNITPTTNEKEPGAKTRRKLIKQIEIVEAEMQSKQRHIAQTQDLQTEIASWRKDFHQNVHQLQNNIQPYKEKFIVMNQKKLDESLYAPEITDT